jgi:hypothetical protein
MGKIDGDDAVTWAFAVLVLSFSALCVAAAAAIMGWAS